MCLMLLVASFVQIHHRVQYNLDADGESLWMKWVNVMGDVVIPPKRKVVHSITLLWQRMGQPQPSLCYGFGQLGRRHHLQQVGQEPHSRKIELGDCCTMESGASGAYWRCFESWEEKSGSAIPRASVLPRNWVADKLGRGYPH
ncbi:hypothetical protein C8R44DRAFT_734744 [Mycena epipterygia]|nr:hypothetical protein C8R44DRAFT_734744 [Mycena epipterygia]